MINLFLIFSYSQDSEQDDLEYQAEKQDLFLYCTAQKHLIDLYVAITNLRENHGDADRDIDITSETGMDSGREQQVAELLHITTTEASEFLNLVDRYRATCLDTPHKLSKCAGASDVVLPTPININKFLTCFAVSSLQQQKRHSNEATASSTSSSSSSPNFKVEIQDVAMTREISLGLG